MSKKRVHEIAKELKGHGIDLDNKEVVTELVSLGYDVKSHSSSLEDDQVRIGGAELYEPRCRACYDAERVQAAATAA